MTVMLVMVLGSQKPKAENPDKHIPSQKKSTSFTPKGLATPTRSCLKVVRFLAF